MASKAEPSGEGRSEQEIFETRLRKAEELRALGIDPWGNGHRVEMTAAAVHAQHGGASAEELDRTRPRCSVGGRIVAQRSFGKAAFLQDTLGILTHSQAPGLIYLVAQDAL